MSRIAVAGAGIAGLYAARLLSRRHDVTVFEASGTPGGHARTVDVTIGGRPLAVDTGFVVYNERAYPNFVRLLDELAVETQPCSMSFSVRCEATGLEWGGATLGSVFAQKRNLLRPEFLRMLRDVRRFGREARELLAGPADAAGGPSLGEYLDARRYSSAFRRHFLVPMISAIWSTEPARMLDYPAAILIRFFENHGILDIRRAPQWRSIRGGSRRYVEAIAESLGDRLRTGTAVRRVERTHDGVRLALAGGGQARFDAVLLAVHSDQALALLDRPEPLEREVLSAIPYQRNDAVLHTDASLMPRNRRAWSSWNVHLPAAAGPANAADHDVPPDRVLVTYCMNLLQNLKTDTPVLLTLNRETAVDPSKILMRLSYTHPLFTREALAAQARHAEVNGAGRTGGVFYAGAYWGYGFHEDGIDSALAAVGHVEDALAREPAHA